MSTATHPAPSVDCIICAGIARRPISPENLVRYYGETHTHMTAAENADRIAAICLAETVRWNAMPVKAASTAKGKKGGAGAMSRFEAAAAAVATNPTVIIQTADHVGRITTTKIQEKPVMNTAPVAPATDAQVAFIGRLIVQKNVGAEIVQSATDAAYSGKAAASQAIEALLACDNRPAAAPAAAPTATVSVPSGHYAVDTEAGHLAFYQVDNVTEGRWAGRTFVSVQASDERHPVRGAAGAAVLAKIAVDPQAAMLRYGREIGRCGHCNRTLTDETSRAAGIGPICAGRMNF